MKPVAPSVFFSISVATVLTAALVATLLMPCILFSTYVAFVFKTAFLVRLVNIRYFAFKLCDFCFVFNLFDQTTSVRYLTSVR